MPVTFLMVGGIIGKRLTKAGRGAMRVGKGYNSINHMDKKL